MTHAGLPVAGYQPQTNTSVDLVNRNKRIEEEVLRILDELAAMRVETEDTNSGTAPVVDQRWLAIGRTAIEQGFMAVNRSIFKPGRVQL